MNAPNVEDFNKICRSCLVKLSRTELTTTKTIQDSEGMITIKSLLQECVSVKILESDDILPQHICSTCLKILTEMHRFRSRCLLNQELLHKVWKTSQKTNLCNASKQENDVGNTQLMPGIKDEQNIGNCMKLDSPHTNDLRTHNSEKPFVCNICDAAFSFKQNLGRHMKSHSNEKQYVCKICGKQYTRTENLTLHMNNHVHKDKNLFFRDETSDLYGCIVCENSFESEGLLKNHMKNHGRTLLCSDCGKAFSNNAQLVVHMRSHTGEKPYSCNECNKAFSTISTLRTHRVTHTDAKPFQCEFCPKRFKLKGALTVHNQSHSGESEKLSCLVCEKKFTRRQLLDVHMRVHTGVKLFACSVCDKRFSQRPHLKHHMRTHSGERPFACEYCGKKFALNCNLTVHKRMHTGERPFQCRLCQKGFMDSSSRKKHEEKQHSGQTDALQRQQELEMQDGGDYEVASVSMTI